MLLENLSAPRPGHPRRAGRTSRGVAVVLAACAAVLVGAPAAAALAAPAAARATAAAGPAWFDAPEADFRAVMGYEPQRLPGWPGVLVAPDGDCSAPTGGTWYGFDDACREHDLAYDLIRFHAATGDGVDPLDRLGADARFGLRMAEHCLAHETLRVLGCLTTASVYAVGVGINSVRQLYAEPVEETVLEVLASTAALLVVCALLLGPAVGARLFRRALHRAERDLPRPPAASGWSGAPGSLVAWDDVGREGRRLLARAPGAAGAVRVFVGLESARRLRDRVALALAEAERAGAFARGTLCVAVPTGSGWVNPAAVEGLERATRGDVATVAVQYAAAPSWLTVLAHPRAHRRAAVALLAAVHARWAELDPATRPRLVVHGESLGANAMAAALRRLPHAAADVAGGLLVAGIGSATWSPPGRVGLVRHDDDPVTRLRPLAPARVWRALPGAGRAPDGCGHRYGPELAAAWAANLGAEAAPAHPRPASVRPGPAVVRPPTPV